MRFILFSIFLLPMTLSAQAYLNSTSQWQFIGGSADFLGNTYHYDRLYYLDGDTLINMESYHKIYTDRRDTTQSLFTGNITHIDSSRHNYFGALRETGQQFYMVQSNASTEILVQDFDVQAGDTIQWDNCNSQPVVVTSIDTVFLGNTPLRRYYLNGLSGEYVLEGIGCTDGFRIGCPGQIGIEYNLNPVCYSRDGHVVPVRLNYLGCSALVASRPTPEVHPIKLFPNPSKGLIRLNLPAEAYELIQCFDATGRFVQTYKPGPDQRLDISMLPDGLYFIVVKSMNKIYRAKVLLQR